MLFLNYLIIILDSCRYDVFLEADTPFLDSIGTLYKGYTITNWTPTSFIAFFGHGMFPYIEGNPNLKYYPRQSFNYLRNLVQYYKIMYTGMPYLSPYNIAIKGLIDLFDKYKFFNHIDIISDTRLYYKLDTMKYTDIPLYTVIWTGETHQPYSTRNNMTRDWRGQLLQDYWKGITDIEPEYFQYLRDRQRQMIEYIDRELSRYKISENTVFILTADHAECLGEDHLYGHGIKPHIKQFEVPVVYGVID